MKQYQGAVFFIDILGVGALTRGSIPLESNDYKSHGISKKENQNEQYFCAKLLIKFRKILNHIKQNNKVEVAQLSDCAFIWSEISIDVVDAAISCMWAAIEAGIFCRGGIAYGNIVEPDRVNSSLGKFILGEAVTKAVHMEGAGKGCRIFSDVDLASKISGHKHFLHEPFVGNKNPNDCLITDELRWYLFSGGLRKHDYANTDKSQAICALMSLVSRLRFSPMFRWNVSTKEGEIHLASSIETISSGVEKFTKELNFRMSSEYLLGHFENNRSAQLQERVLNTWRKEIQGLFNKSNNIRRRQTK